MIALPPENTTDFYTTATTTSNVAGDAWIDCNAMWTEIHVTIFSGAVSQEQAEEPEHPRLRPPRPRRSFRPPAVPLDFARRPVNRHPSARRAFRY